MDMHSPEPAPALRRQIDTQRSSLARRLGSALQMAMALLGFAWLVLVVLDYTRGLGPILTGVSRVIWGAFVLDFLLRFSIAPRKLTFLRRNVLTLLSLLLPALRMARLARLARGARAVRGVKLVKVLASLNRGMRAARRTLRRRGFGYLLLLTLLVLLGGSAGMYALEPEGLPDFGTALWWTAMILVTMGSEWWPRTPEGRLLCLALSLYGFTVFGYFTATIASVFIAGDAERERRDRQAQG